MGAKVCELVPSKPAKQWSRMAKEQHTRERLWNVQKEVPSQRTQTGPIHVPAIISCILIHIRCFQRCLGFSLFCFDTEALHPGMVISRTPRLASSCGSKMTRGLARNASLPENRGLYYSYILLLFIHTLHVILWRVRPCSLSCMDLMSSGILAITHAFNGCSMGGKVEWKWLDLVAILVLGHSLSGKEPS